MHHSIVSCGIYLLTITFASFLTFFTIITTSSLLKLLEIFPNFCQSRAQTSARYIESRWTSASVKLRYSWHWLACAGLVPKHRGVLGRQLTHLNLIWRSIFFSVLILVAQLLLLDLGFAGWLWLLWKPLSCLLLFCWRILLVFLFQILYGFGPRGMSWWVHLGRCLVIDGVELFIIHLLLISWHTLYSFLRNALPFILALCILWSSFLQRIFRPLTWPCCLFPPGPPRHILLLIASSSRICQVLWLKLCPISSPCSWYRSTANLFWAIVLGFKICLRVSTQGTETLLLVNFQLLRFVAVVTRRIFLDQI